MEIADLMSEDFNPWEIAISRESIAQMQEAQSRLDEFRQRLDQQISRMHRHRLEAREAAGLPRRECWSSTANNPNASCRFGSFAADGTLRYSGQVWFRNECDGFDAQDCEPLPGELLGADETQIKAHFAGEAALARQALDLKQQAADEDARVAREAAERAEFERLRLKFASG
jgi:hypothetical protein